MYSKSMKYIEASKLLKNAPIGYKVILSDIDKVISNKMSYLSIGIPSQQKAGLLRSCGYSRSHHENMCWIKKRNGYVASRYQSNKVSRFAAEEEITEQLDREVEYKNADIRRLTKYPVEQSVINIIMDEAGFIFNPETRTWKWRCE